MGHLYHLKVIMIISGGEYEEMGDTICPTTLYVILKTDLLSFIEFHSRKWMHDLPRVL